MKKIGVARLLLGLWSICSTLVAFAWAILWGWTGGGLFLLWTVLAAPIFLGLTRIRVENAEVDILGTKRRVKSIELTWLLICLVTICFSTGATWLGVNERAHWYVALTWGLMALQASFFLWVNFVISSMPTATFQFGSTTALRSNTQKKVAAVFSKTFTLLLTTIGIVLFLGYCRSQLELTIHDVDKRVMRLVPIGTKANVAIASLDSAHIAHTSYDSETYSIGAKITDPMSIGIVTHAFQVDFMFGKEHKLGGHKTKEVFTGP